MTPDGLAPQQQRETASLTMVRVQRRRSSLQPSRNKAGDLTAKLMDEKASAPVPAPAPDAPTSTITTPSTPTVLPSAPERALVEPAEDTTGTIVALPPPEPQAEKEFEPPAVEATPEPPVPVTEDEPAFAPIADVPLAPRTEQAAEMPPVEDHAADAEHETVPTAADALIDYWDERAGDRLFPALAELDRERIAQSWPNTVLLTFGGGDMPRMTRLGEPDGEVEYNLMVTDWILSRGRQAAARAEALEEEQRFPVGRGRARYRLVLLPCSNEGSRVDHMLCHVSRLSEQPKLGAVASFKRWLAS